MIRIGFGTDIHRLAGDLPLKLGGILIPSDLGVEGHSDADVLFHAATDAILGALAAGDIGSHFSDTDPRWKGAESEIFLREALRMMSERGFAVVNIDSTIHLEKPKLRSHILEIRRNLARILDVDLSQVSVKAKTGEKIDGVGECRAIRSDAVVLLESK